MSYQLNCPNCGAPITGDRCEYCGTQFIDCTVKLDKPFYLKINPDGKTTYITKVFLEEMTIERDSDTFEYGRDIYGRIVPTHIQPVHRFTATYVSVSQLKGGQHGK
jgi:hypothetical protein